MSEPFVYPLILASASPRREQLLREAGYVFDIVPCPINEPVVPSFFTLAAAPWAEALAYFKARYVAQLHPEAIIIGADTVVTHGDNIIGKPHDEADARRILSTMFSGRNEVITGLTVLCLAQKKRIITHQSTTLVMRNMNPDELNHYIDTGAWRGKAGAYALQEGGDRFVQSMEGSESNVVGLPMEKLQEVLSQFMGYPMGMIIPGRAEHNHLCNK